MGRSWCRAAGARRLYRGYPPLPRWANEFRPLRGLIPSDRAGESTVWRGFGLGAQAGAAQDELDEGGGGARQGAVGAVDEAELAP